ncbi:MAG: glycosyltransferase [Campylobacteraceae bacterium]|jgi:glycosyltransferase involved in cell wall biosynthesis|nr:glycosyltransferase [Campylobacteraceae bacterium]
MKKQPAVSVIVPIYNVEKYLRQCLDSIVEQTLHDIEIILINDGSKDGSLAIMKEYAKQDERIKIIDKPNEGYGKTMNRGLDIAIGEYIGIVESDDWIERDMFEQLYKLAKQHDVEVVKSNFYKYTTKDGERSEKERLLPENDAEQIINPKERSNIFYCQPSIWSAIYKRAFLDKYKIRFLESPGASYQDVGFNFKVWAMADKVWLTSNAFLHYRCDNENQSVNSRDKVFCVCDEWEEIERFMDDYSRWKKSSYKLRNHVKWGNYHWNLNRLEYEKREEFRKRIAAEYRQIIKNNGMERNCFNQKEWLNFLLVLNPKSKLLKIAYVTNNISRIFVKSRINNGKKRWFVFGVIRIKKVDAKLPIFLKKEK